MPGIARVTEAMMWLMKEGSMWRKMIRELAGAVQAGRHHEILLAQGQESARAPRAPGRSSR